MVNWFTAESFGSELPENWEEIADYLNEIAEERGIDNDNEINDLWEEYWGAVFDAEHRNLPETVRVLG